MGAQLNEVQELETRVTNVFSVDVEDYFHVEAFSDIVPRERWDSYPLRVEDNTRRILDLLDDQRSRQRSSFSAGSPRSVRRSYARSPIAVTRSPVTHTGTA
jgi:hypothetical protein